LKKFIKKYKRKEEKRSSTIYKHFLIVFVKRKIIKYHKKQRKNNKIPRTFDIKELLSRIGKRRETI
jgi:hypothetical protein